MSANLIKYYSSTDPSAPTIGNNWGDLTALLDAVLVDGYNLKTVASITRSGSTATAVVSAGHPYQVGRILSLGGSDQADYNGEKLLTAVTSTTFSFEVTGSPATPATGSISAKVAPLGFEVAYTDGAHKRAYRSQLPASSKPILLVNAGEKGTNAAGTTYNSSWAKWANVGIVENMTDINTLVGSQAPFDAAYPTRNRGGGGLANQYGWAKWYWAMSSSGTLIDSTPPTAGDRPWALVGDGRSFYLWLGRLTGVSVDAVCSYGFGEFKSFKSADTKAAWIVADEFRESTTSFGLSTIGAHASFGVAGGGAVRGNNGVGANGKWILESFDGLAQGAGFTLTSMSGITVSGSSATPMPTPNGPDYALWLHTPIYLREDAGHMRGVMPGLAHIPHNAPYPDRYRIPASASNGTKDWLVVRSNYASTNSQNPAGAQVALQISGEWEY